MADKAAGSSGGGSRIPRDAFISRVVPDPANLEPEAPHVLRGYVGDSDEPGYSRIYCGPGLEVYGDVADEDILHFEQGSNGGEHTLWARPGAQVKYGRRGGAKSEASSFVDGPLLNDYGGGTGGGGTGGPIGITGWLGCGQATHLIGCTGYQGCHQPTHLIGCTGYLGCHKPTQLIGCTGYLGCHRPTSTCPETIHPTIWTQIGCSTQAGCIPTVGLGCPGTSTCPPAGGGPQELAAAAPLGPTGYQGCTSMMGCPNTSTCTPHTHMPGCPNTSTCTPQTHLLGCPNTSTCTPQTYMPGCPDTATCTPQTHMLGCPRTSTCPPTYMPGCPSTSTCTPGAGDVSGQSTAATLCTRYGCEHQSTLATVCTQIGCQHQSTAATLCTRYGCPGPATYQPACTLGFTCTYVGCP